LVRQIAAGVAARVVLYRGLKFENVAVVIGSALENSYYEGR